MNRQMTLAEMNDEFGAARTNKKEFLNKMDSVIPWETFVKEIEPYYTKGIDFAQAENALRFTAYNLRRAINMIGVDKLIELIKGCLPLYYMLKSIVTRKFRDEFYHKRFVLLVLTR